MATHDPLAPYRAKRDFTRTMPFAWREATAALDPRPFTVATAPPVRLHRADPWAGFAAARPLPKPR
jgi:DNA primase